MTEDEASWARRREGWVDVGDGQHVWWAECGNRDGLPVLVVHGGPGGGTLPAMRRPFSPETYRVVMFDQRGCGRSTPHASDIGVDLAHNTTQSLIADMEVIRVELEIDRWVLSGSSWGSTLALAYAQEHPDRAMGMILRSITTFRRSELDWVYRYGASQLLPERWEEFVAAVPPELRDDLPVAYHRLVNSEDAEQRLSAALAWGRWEMASMLLHPDPEIEGIFAEPRFASAFARISTHYSVNHGFLEDGELIDRARDLSHIPAILLSGRLDLCTPPTTAWQLHHAWPGSELLTPRPRRAPLDRGSADLPGRH